MLLYSRKECNAVKQLYSNDNFKNISFPIGKELKNMTKLIPK